MATEVVVSEALQAKVDALGEAGRRWLDDLPAIVELLCDKWGLTLGRALGGGSAAYVVAAETSNGTSAVLKVAMPDGLEGNGDFGRELAALRAGQGHGYVGLLGFDHDRRAVLLERLGRALATLDLAVEDRLDAIAATVSAGWHASLPPEVDRTGAQQADFLTGFVTSRWEQLGHPCPVAVVDEAVRCARSRCNAVPGARSAVLVHGDGHAANVLERSVVPGTYKLIDPDAMRSEPAHDLGIAARDNSEGLLQATSPRGTLHSWCARLADRATAEAAIDVDPDAVWEWAFAERVSSGLFLLELGLPRGATFLSAAAALLDG
jgi:streptomycin 6-kinase